MPQTVIDVTGGTDREPVQGSQILDESHIFGVSARILTGSTTSGRTHVQVAVYRGVALEENILVVLLDDYVYGAHTPSWTGRFPTEEGQGLVVNVRSADGPTVRVTTQSQKMDP